MKVAFVSSGNSLKTISPIIKAQGDSLSRLGLDIEYVPIEGKGLWGYLKNIPAIKRKIKIENADIVHAHFSFSAFAASLAGAKPIVVSLMGWNIEKPYLKLMIRIFNFLFWDACIVKSERMKISLGIKDVMLLPNGVDTDYFKPMGKEVAMRYLGWSENKTHLLWAANPERPIKNFELAREAFNNMKKEGMELHFLENVPHEKMVYYYNASDVVFLTSIAEGSPNVIKEALACNCKVVSTDVGDVSERFQDNPACFLAEHNAADIAEKLKMALDYEETIETRELVMELDSKIIAEKLILLYEGILSKKKGI